jgi:ABC-type bacteriocin/lantibiotic exporter with double-glycine peptidase domain
MALSQSSRNTHDFTSSRMENVFIGISGLIGAGKSTLAKVIQ